VHRLQSPGFVNIYCKCICLKLFVQLGTVTVNIIFCLEIGDVLRLFFVGLL
jgi:hypothetical protein